VIVWQYRADYRGWLAFDTNVRDYGSYEVEINGVMCSCVAHIRPCMGGVEGYYNSGKTGRPTESHKDKHIPHDKWPEGVDTIEQKKAYLAMLYELQ